MGGYKEAGDLSGRKLVYTTNKAGNEPIMSTKVNDGYPCAYPEQRTSDAIYYPLERSKYIPR